MALLVLLTSPSVVLAEVSDKMLPIPLVVTQGVAFATVALALAWYRWWLAVLGIGFGLLMVIGTVELWREVHMREALIHEQGVRYFVALAAGDLLVVIASVVGAVVGRRRQHAA
jgi:hypothetical protein